MQPVSFRIDFHRAAFSLSLRFELFVNIYLYIMCRNVHIFDEAEAQAKGRVLNNSVSDSYDYDLTAEEREELEDIVPPSGGITYRSQDFDIAGLVKRLNDNDILIPRIGSADPNLEVSEFQRGFVWSKKQMDSFIESLLLEYPVPGFFMVQQEDRRLVVLDGQQRLETLRRFYAGLNGDRKFRIGIAGSRFQGFSYEDLSDRDRRVLDNTYITSTVISAGADAKSREAIYDVFARLNSGGTQLTSHEIRMALFNGKLMSLIDDENRKKQWRQLYGSDEVNKRFRDHELIMRSLALYLEGDSYSKPLGSFLNKFSEKYRDGDSRGLKTAIAFFGNAVDLLASSNLDRPFSLAGHNQLNNARAEAILVAIMRELGDGRTVKIDDIKSMIKHLDSDEQFEMATTSSTSDESQVKKRLACSKQALERSIDNGSPCLAQ